MSMMNKVTDLLKGDYSSTLVGDNKESIARWAKMTGIALATVMSMSALSGANADAPDLSFDNGSGYSQSQNLTPDLDDRFSFSSDKALSYSDTLHNNSHVFSSDGEGEHFERGKQITMDVLNALSGDRAQDANIYILDGVDAVDNLHDANIDLSKPIALSFNGEQPDKEDLIISLSNIGDTAHFGGTSLQNAEFKSYHEAFHGIQYLDNNGLDNNIRTLAGDSQVSAGFAVQSSATQFSADMGYDGFQEQMTSHVMSDFVDHQYENGADVFAVLAMNMDLNAAHADQTSPEYQDAKGELNDFIRGVVNDRQGNFANDAAHGTAPMLNQLRIDIHKGNIQVPDNLEDVAKLTTQYLEDNKQLSLDGFVKNYQNSVPTQFVGEDGQSFSMAEGEEGLASAMQTIQDAAQHAHDQLIGQSLSLNAQADAAPVNADVNLGDSLEVSATQSINQSFDMSSLGIVMPKALDSTGEASITKMSDKLQAMRDKRDADKKKTFTI